MLDLCAEDRAGERRAGLTIAALVALAVALAVLPEAAIECPERGAAALAVALAEGADRALARGESPLDFWFSAAEMGFPVFHHDPGLAHVALVAAHRASGGALPIATAHRFAQALLLALFPLAVFAGLRRLGLGPLAAAGAAVAAPLVAGPGLGFEAVLFGGEGLYPQLLGAVLAPLALGECGRAIREGRGIGGAAALLGATFAAHLLFGYVVALSLPAFLFAPGERRERAVRLAIVFGAAFLGASYFLVPALRHAEFASHAASRPRAYWESAGAASVLRSLVRGELLDGRRLPILTVLAALGLVAAIVSRREVPRALAGLFVAWTAILCGPATWGPLLDVLPLARDLPFSRLVGAVHLFGIALAGIGLFAIVRAIGAGRTRARSLAAAAAAALLLLPAALERGRWLEESRAAKRETKAAFEADRDFAPLLDALAGLEPGRVYVEPEGPLRALCMLREIDALPALWHGLSFAADLAPLARPDDAAHCRAFGIRYLVFDAARAPPPFAHPRGGSGRYRIFEVPDASYFGLAEVPFAVYVSKRTLRDVGADWLASGVAARGFEPLLIFAPDAKPSAELGLRAVFRSAAAAPPPAMPGVVRASGSWSCEAELSGDAAVFLRASFHPGLRASLDGAPAPVVAVLPGFPAVLARAGRHAIRFWYEPAPHAPSLLAGAVAIALAPLLWRRLAPGLSRGARLPAARAAWIAAGVQALIAAVAFVGVQLASLYGFSGASVFCDVQTYFTYLERARGEYPLLALPLFAIPRLFTADFEPYAALFALEMLLVNALALRLGAARIALREGSARVPGRLAWWTAFFLALTPTTVTRFDLGPTAIAFAGAVWWSGGRPTRGGGAVAIGLLMKVFPGAVAIPALAAWPGRRRGALALAAGIAAGVGIWIALDGPGPLDMLRYHGERGIEFGSVYSGILYAVARLAGAPVSLHEDHGSQNLVTAWAPFAAKIALPLQAAALLLVAWRSRRPAARDGVRYAGAAVLAFFLPGKVLSVQYLIWLIPFVAVLGGRTGRVARLLFLPACVATSVVYPWGFSALVALDPWVFALVNARNLLLLGLLATLLFGPEDDGDAERDSLTIPKQLVHPTHPKTSPLILS